MKHLTIKTSEFKTSDLSPLHFGWCNAINTKALEQMRRQSNLEIVDENENKAYQYHYFFDLRDCNDPDYRPQGQTPAEVLDFVSREVCDLMARVEHIKNCEISEDDDTLYDKLDALARRMDKLQEDAYDLSEELKK